MEVQIRENIVYLCANISNLTEILLHLREKGIISKDESEQIAMPHLTTLAQNDLLLKILEKKDWNEVGNVFLEILRKTNNKNCADKIQGKPITHIREISITHPKISKWWPDKKVLIKSLHKRKCGNKLLVEELHDRILKDENRMVVLRESSDAAKFSGMGGVGKTLTAKWYARHYEKEYAHILWIDCGEDSLLKSFKELARDLKMEDRNEFEDEVEKLARKCFQVLSNFTCLWIYDNAESYQGEEGILKVLPKSEENFFCLITSRSVEWGIKNIGFGRISDLQLEIFTEEESVEFFEVHLDEKIKRNGDELRELCRLMGNLPLALQLAAAALNSGKIDLHNFLQKTTAEDAAQIVDSKFDDYEKTINKNIKISLDLILQDKKNGKLAFDILMAFGYIRPDDVQSKLFLKIFKSNVGIVKGAVDILEKYSLVARTGSISEFPYDDGVVSKIFGWDKVKVEMDLLSIHRLLQQVIRHNGKERERETLKNILACDGFLEYKLIPFTKYAEEDLKKQFPKVRAGLLDQQQLRKLLRDRRFEDAVQLAKFIDQELKTKTTTVNYAICQEKNGQLEECADTLEKCIVVKVKRVALKNVGEFFRSCKCKLYVDKDWELFHLEDMAPAPTETNVADLLFNIYMRLQKYEQALALISQIGSTAQIERMLSKTVNENRFEVAVELAKFIDQELNTNTTKVNYAICLEKNGQLEECKDTLEKCIVVKVKRVALKNVAEFFKNCNCKLYVDKDWELFRLEGRPPTETNVADSLFNIYMRLHKYEQALALIKQIGTTEQIERMLSKTLDENRCEDAVQLAKFIDQEIKTKTTKLNYAICLQKSGQLEECVKIVEQMFVKRNINGKNELVTCVGELFKSAHKMAVLTPQEYDYPKLVDLAKGASEVDVGTVLLYSHLRLGNHQAALPIAKQTVTDPGQLIGILTFTQVPNYHLQVDYHYSNTIDLKLDVEKKNIYLRSCSLSLNSFERLSPEDLTLDRVSFLRDGRQLEKVNVNDFLDLRNIKRLTLDCHYKTNLSLDLSGDVCMESLELRNVKVLNWHECKWNVKKLKLDSIPFVEKTNIRVQEFTFSDSSLDVSCLPQKLQQLTLHAPKIFVSGKVELPNLNYLELEKVDAGCLSHFRSAPLTHIRLFGIKKEVNVDLLPQTLSSLKITKTYNYNARVVGGVRKVDKLILQRFSFAEVEEFLSHLQTDSVVLAIHSYIAFSMESLLLLSKKIKTIAVERNIWDIDRMDECPSEVSYRNEYYYLLEGGRGMAMEWEEFKELKKLF